MTPTKRDTDRKLRAAICYEDLIVAQYRAQKTATAAHVATKLRADRAFSDAGGRAALDEASRHRAATNAGHRITGDMMIGRCLCDGPECVEARRVGAERAS